MATADLVHSAEFRRHIDSILRDYALAHCTTNYIEFTEGLVSEFIDDLKPVSYTEPYSFILEVDPFQTFSRLHDLASIPPFGEQPQTTSDAVQYIKQVIGSLQGGVPITERLRWTDECEESILPEPLIPMLTRRSIRETPKFGAGKQNNIPKSLVTLLQCQKFNTIDVEEVQEEVLNVEELLHVTLQIDPEQVPVVRSLLQKTIDSLRPQKKADQNKYSNVAFLHEEISDNYEYPEEIFTPIFSRSRWPGSGVPAEHGHLPELKSLKDIPKVAMTKCEMKDPDLDLSLQNLVTVDGWEAIRSSPPTTPLSGSDDQLDELFLESSPNTEPSLVQEFMDAKMDEIEIPRNRRLGGNHGITPHILAGKTFASFILPLLDEIKGPENLLDQTSKTQEHSGKGRESSPTTSSLRAQPSSAIDGEGVENIVAKVDAREEDLDTELKRIYDGHLENIILNETLDNTRDMTMKVPTLPPPNEHPPNEVQMSKKLSDFIITDNSRNANRTLYTTDNSSRILHNFLKKVKGTQSLGLQLSWIPFTVDKKLPTVVELIDVTGPFSNNNWKNTEGGTVNALELAMKLINSLNLDDAGLTTDNPCRNWTEEISSYEAPSIPDDLRIMLNRKELRVLEKGVEDVDMTAGEEVLSIHSQSGSREQSLFREHARDDPDFASESPRPSKRLRLDNFQTDLDAVGSGLQSNEASIFRMVPVEPASPVLEDDKENWPPISSSLAKDDYFAGGLDDFGFDGSGMPRFEGDNVFDAENEGSFEPLSFESRHAGAVSRLTYDNEGDIFDPEYLHLSAHSQVQDPNQVTGVNILNYSASSSREPLTNNSTTLLLSSEPAIASHALGISAFAQLRAKKVSDKSVMPLPEPSIPDPDPAPVQPIEEFRGPPSEIVDANTVLLPENIAMPQSMHRYMASLDLIQKRALVRALCSEECTVELVERQTLGGVDLILDVHSAVVFLPLFTLPARCSAYVDRVIQQSSSFSYLLVVFEAFPEHYLKRSSNTRPMQIGALSTPSDALEPYAYTPPIIKAIKKFRRDVNIADALRTTGSPMAIHCAFAGSVNEAALITRWYGNSREEVDETHGAIWGAREWLLADCLEDEENNLASLNGMNNFSASIVLCQISIQQFVDMPPEERVNNFAAYIGVDPLEDCNSDLESRFRAMRESSDGPGM